MFQTKKPLKIQNIWKLFAPKTRKVPVLVKKVTPHGQRLSGIITSYEDDGDHQHYFYDNNDAL